MTTVLDYGRDACVGQWVDAAPFRAHLRHLMAVGDLSCAMVALLAGITPKLAQHLLQGRRGRPLRRISPETARRLLGITAEEARTVRERRVYAGHLTQDLRRLRAAGWSDEALAELLGLIPSSVVALVHGRTRVCRQQLALKAAAEVAQLPDDFRWTTNPSPFVDEAPATAAA